ncbi:hypothetical protein [Arenivirga flava]|nr:hypothetical protein [Arenivirga flava]
MALVVTFAMGAGANGFIGQDAGTAPPASAAQDVGSTPAADDSSASVRVTADEEATEAYEAAERERLRQDSEHVAQVSTAPTPEPTQEPQAEQAAAAGGASPGGASTGGSSGSGARVGSGGAAPASGGGAQPAAAPAQQAAPAAPVCPSSIGGGAGGAPGGSTGSGIGRTTNDDLAGFAAAYNAIRVANCLEPVPYGNFRYSSCMEDRLVWMAEDPDPNPVSTWGHAGTISNSYSQSVPDRGCDGNLAGGSGNTGATMAQKWWDSSAHRASLYKPGSSVAGVCITFAMTHGGLPSDGYGFTRASARWGGC